MNLIARAVLLFGITLQCTWSTGKHGNVLSDIQNVHSSVLLELYNKSQQNDNVVVSGLGMATVLYMAAYSDKENLDKLQYFSNLPQESGFQFTNTLELRPGVQLVEAYEQWLSKTFKATSVVHARFPGITWINNIKLDFTWKTPFDSSATREYSFTLADKSTVMVPYMIQHTNFRVYKDDGIEAVKLDYQPVDGKRYAALIMKPSSVRDASADGDLKRLMELHLVQDVNERLNDKNSLKYMEIHLPKFKIEADNDDLHRLQTRFIVEKLRSLDLDRIQVRGLGGIDSIKFRQTISMDVDEHGTKAECRTSLSVTDGMPKRTVFDSPFVFHVIDSDTGLPILSAIVRNPLQGSAKPRALLL